MGLYYQPPGPCVGGRQPYEPSKLVPPSGPTPQNPPLTGSRVALAVLIAWIPGPNQPILSVLSTPPSAPTLVIRSRSVTQEIRAWHDQAPPPIILRSFFTPSGPSPQNPQFPGSSLPSAVSASWALPPPPLPTLPPFLQSSGPSPQNPPIVGARIQESALNWWRVPPPPLPTLGQVLTASGPTPQNPPFSGTKISREVLTAWLGDPVIPPLRENLIPQPITTVFLPAPQFPWAVLNAWAAQGAPPPRPILFLTASGPAPQNPPFPGAPVPATVRSWWDLLPPPLPVLLPFLTPSGPPPQNPPLRSAGVPRPIMDSWADPPPYVSIPIKFVQAPLPSFVPPSGAKALQVILNSWLPQAPQSFHRTFRTSGGPIAQAPPLVGSSIPASVLAWWRPEFPPIASIFDRFKHIPEPPPLPSIINTFFVAFENRIARVGREDVPMQYPGPTASASPDSVADVDEDE